MLSSEIRQQYLDFFQSKGHLLLPSSSLIPAGDPTLLLTPAGMVQFKPYFTGEAQPPRRRLTSVQKCFRVTDVESVGDTSHLTFFEMLGNFSIGDYFKKEAIAFAWEFVTQYAKLPPERLWTTVFLDDDEALDLWVKQGVPAERIRRLGEKDNFWGPAGDEGPCGPCSEIHIDFGGPCRQGKPAEQCGPDCSCGRFLELWNLVFMQFFQDRQKRRTPLPKPNIDTGMGLERITRVLQGVPSVYDTDIFQPIITKVVELSGKAYGRDPQTNIAIRVVAEHARSASFLIADGVVPGNAGRGYVLRRLIRRAILFGNKLGLAYDAANANSFLAAVAAVVIQHLGGVYPELAQGRTLVLRVLQQEEAQFAAVLERGNEYLEDLIRSTPMGAQLPGAELFKLHDTYGFPVEVTAGGAQEHGLQVDMEGFKKEMEAQRERARAAGGFGGDFERLRVYQELGTGHTTFLGYETAHARSEVIGIIVNGERASSVAQGQEAEVVLRETPFYAEGGGQTGDAGQLEGPRGVFLVEDTQSPITGLTVHKGHVAGGAIAMGETVSASIDQARRNDAARNHTATHLLHAALRQMLGAHVRQQGSLVTPDRLRFDFTHVSAVAPQELRQMEDLVNDRIRANLPVYKRETTYRQAVAEGALAFFGERYGDRVRVVEVGGGELPSGVRPHSPVGGALPPPSHFQVAQPFSFEVCGGTHINATGEIGYCHILGESSVGAGLRRIEAVTGRAAVAYMREQQALIAGLCQQLEASPRDLPARIEGLLAGNARLRREAEAVQRATSLEQAQQMLAKAVQVGSFKMVAARANVASAEALREIGDWLRDKLGSGVVILAAVIGERPSILIMATQDVVARGAHAGNMVHEAAKAMGGGGGGRPDMAQGGGRDAGKLDDALRAAQETLAKQVKG